MKRISATDRLQKYLISCVAKGLLLGGLGASSLAMAAIPAGIGSARLQANNQIDFWQKQISHDKTIEGKYRDFGQMLKDLHGLGDANMSKSQSDENYISVVVSVLESLPDQSSFRKDNCDRYENDFLNHFQPVADDDAMEPAVRPGWNLLESLCRN